MKHPEKWSLEELRDVESISFYEREKAKRPDNADMSDVLAQIQVVGRDNSRTPMQWDGSNAAGFTTGVPWIKVAEDFATWKVDLQTRSTESVPSFWKQLITLRKSDACFVYGRFEPVSHENEDIYAFRRIDNNSAYLIVCSFRQEVFWQHSGDIGYLLLSNHSKMHAERPGLRTLRPLEARLYKRSTEIAKL